MLRWLFIGILLFPWSLANAANPFEQKGWLEHGSFVEHSIQYPRELEAIYQHNDYRLNWTDKALQADFERQIDAVARCHIASIFADHLARLRWLRQHERIQAYDLVATDTLLMYLSYLDQLKSHGREWLFTREHDITLPAPLMSAVRPMLRAIADETLPQFVASLASPMERNASFVHTYQHMTIQSYKRVPFYHQQGSKRHGDKLSHRSELLGRLAVVGIDVSKLAKPGSYYNKALLPAVEQFQKMHGLKQDGVIGPETLRWLNMPVEQRLDSLALNAQRSRLWPAKRDWLVLVNVPNFDVQFWHNGKSLFESKVVVGRLSRKTPVMMGQLDSVILNPTWNIPYKIMVEDIIPKAKQDPHYLASHNIEVIKSWSDPSVVEDKHIDWAKVDANTFPYRMRQRSGYHNALGMYKFNIPNSRAIFLHDTPSKWLFSYDKRTFSSGCVRVQKAAEFASVLFASQGLNEQPAKQGEKDKANHSVPLRRHIPVHIIYQTAWAENGMMNYRDDIYRYDERIVHSG